MRGVFWSWAAPRSRRPFLSNGIENKWCSDVITVPDIPSNPKEGLEKPVSSAPAPVANNPDPAMISGMAPAMPAPKALPGHFLSGPLPMQQLQQHPPQPMQMQPAQPQTAAMPMQPTTAAPMPMQPSPVVFQPTPTATQPTMQMSPPPLPQQAPFQGPTTAGSPRPILPSNFQQAGPGVFQSDEQPILHELSL